MTSIFRLSWDETSLSSKIQLFFKSRGREKPKIHSSDPILQAEGCSALSSTYYSIAGTGASQLKASLKPIWLAPPWVALWFFSWFPLTLWCYWRMLPLSNRVVKIIGYERMTSAQCDIRQSILRRRGRLAEAKKCIEAALKKTAEIHTIGLLLIALSHINFKQNNLEDANKHLYQAEGAAQEAEKQDPRQAARIYRHCSSLVDKLVGYKGGKESKRFMNKAISLAETAGANDQLLKS